MEKIEHSMEQWCERVCVSGYPQDLQVIVYSYFMHVCSIVKTITPRCHGQLDALFHKAEGRVQ